MKYFIFIFIFLFTFNLYAELPEKLPRNDLVVAAVLILEAGGEQDERAMAAIYEVIKNRSKERDLSCYEVVRQKLQFSSLNSLDDTEAIRLAQRHKKWLDAVEIVYYNHNSNFTKGANHFHSGKPPYWAKPQNKTIKIENHIFYKL